jgi:outer membrane protein OmpA-like peptidoglycan-associated protein
MNVRCSLALCTSLVLFGCAAGERVKKDAPTPLALSWERSAWRFCNPSECARPTPKSVVIDPPPVVTPTVAAMPEPLQVPVKALRTVSVPFHFASARLTAQAASVLRREFAQGNVGDSIVIEGRTDDLGSQSFNDRLARNRAEAVAAFLKQLGVSGPVTIQSQGKCCYLTANRSDESRARNRRVDLQISTTQKE